MTASQSPINQKGKHSLLLCTFIWGGPTARFLGPWVITRFIATAVSLHTQLLSFKEWTNAIGQQGWEEFIPRHHAACSRNVCATLNGGQTLSLGLTGQDIVIFLFYKVYYPLRSPFFSLLPCISTINSPLDKSTHIWIMWKIWFRQQVPPPHMLISCCK